MIKVDHSLVRRPAFIVGTKFQPDLQPIRPDFPVQKRSLDVEGRLRRKNFMVTAPASRKAQTIEEIEALKTKQQGIKIRFGEGQFKDIKVAKRDKQGNLIKDEEGNVVFETKVFNMSMINLPLQDRMEMVVQALAEGSQNFTGEKLDTLGILLASILSSDIDIANLTKANTSVLSQVLQRDLTEVAEVARGKDFKDLIDGRYVTHIKWQTNNNNLHTRVHNYLLKFWQAIPGLSSDEPYFGLVPGKSNKLGSIGSSLGKTPQQNRHPVLDLGSRRMFPTLQVAQEKAGEASEFAAFGLAAAAAAAADSDEEKEEVPDDPIEKQAILQSRIAQIIQDPSGTNVLTDLRSALQQQQQPIQVLAPTPAVVQPVQPVQPVVQPAQPAQPGRIARFFGIK